MNPRRTLQQCAIAAFCILAAPEITAAPPHAPRATITLRKQDAALYRLYNAYTPYHDALRSYATRQGFIQPYENLGTVIHELIHIASAVHQGYYVDGIYYEPYLSKAEWPAATNRLILANLTPAEKSNIIAAIYMPATPDNNLGSILDELNAYGHVAPFICKNEPTSTAKQVHNLLGFINIEEAYLRTVRSGFRSDYDAMSANQRTRGALTLIVTRAWQALDACGVAETAVPREETLYFFSLKNNPAN